MALWGNNDNITATGIVTVNYSTRVVTGNNSGFGESGKIQEGDVIRFGSLEKPGTYSVTPLLPALPALLN